MWIAKKYWRNSGNFTTIDFWCNVLWIGLVMTTFVLWTGTLYHIIPTIALMGYESAVYLAFYLSHPPEDFHHFLYRNPSNVNLVGHQPFLEFICITQLNLFRHSNEEFQSAKEVFCLGCDEGLTKLEGLCITMG